MAFDGAVLRALTDLYQRGPQPNLRLCTLRLARRLLARELESKALGNVYDYYVPGSASPRHEDHGDIADLAARSDGTQAIIGERVCMTGTLTTGQRATVQRLISLLGGTPISR